MQQRRAGLLKPAFTPSVCWSNSSVSAPRLVPLSWSELSGQDWCWILPTAKRRINSSFHWVSWSAARNLPPAPSTCFMSSWLLRASHSCACLCVNWLNQWSSEDEQGRLGSSTDALMGQLRLFRFSLTRFWSFFSLLALTSAVTRVHVCTWGILCRAAGADPTSHGGRSDAPAATAQHLHPPSAQPAFFSSTNSAAASDLSPSSSTTHFWKRHLAALDETSLF